MASPDTAKPASAPRAEPAPKIEQLGGQLFVLDTQSLVDRQALRLTRRFAITCPLVTGPIQRALTECAGIRP
jgi:hypothetical protein